MKEIVQFYFKVVEKTDDNIKSIEETFQKFVEKEEFNQLNLLLNKTRKLHNIYFSYENHCGKVKHELRVQIHGLWVQIHGLQVQIHGLKD